MRIDEALSTLRSIADRLHASGCHWRSERIIESADAIEAAMREPVCTVDDLQFMNLHGTELEPGTKLFTFPPDAAGEIERLTKIAGLFNTISDERLEASLEIERMKSDLHAAECEIEELRDSRDFYKRRCDELQKAQRDMRDPERKAVCDILANGKTAAFAGKEERS